MKNLLHGFGSRPNLCIIPPKMQGACLVNNGGKEKNGIFAN